MANIGASAAVAMIGGLATVAWIAAIYYELNMFSDRSGSLGLSI